MRYDPPRILLVEEDPTLAEVTGFRLELLGYTLEAVHSAEEAFESIDRTLPDTIIVDIMVSASRGIDLVNQLANDRRTANIPIMVFSANADLDDVQKAFDAGAKDFLVTPYDPAVLERKLMKLLSGQNQAV